MTFVKTKDGVEIFYKDWGKGQPIVFSHGWPLSGASGTGVAFRLSSVESLWLAQSDRASRCFASGRR